ncbi:unnamed protein product [Larinioides sclopetarius]|uniref:Uncharacterized protein n=1 Tax=Larinioides sclopetarius TaxID=280406 RepID=A0AAV1YUP7_9ARAC
MAKPNEDSRIVVPFLPGLSHISLVKLAVSLFEDLGGFKSNIRFTGIQTENSAAHIEFFEEDKEGNYKTTKKDLDFVPALLRKKVLEAIEGLQNASQHWKQYHSIFLELKDENITFHWRFDGIIDTIKTVQHLVLDKHILIRKRFRIACRYCLVESILKLWSEMGGFSTIEHDETSYSPMEQFWIKWMYQRCPKPWRQVAVEYFKHGRGYPLHQLVRYSNFFPFEQPEDRRRNLFHVEIIDGDDLLLCLYTLTKEEGLLERGKYALKVLGLYLKWPLQILFLETAEKLRNYIDYRDFMRLLYSIFAQKSLCDDFDYHELFETFWGGSPNIFQYIAKQDPHLNKTIDLWLEKMRQRREAFDNLRITCDQRFGSSQRRKRRKELGDCIL